MCNFFADANSLPWWYYTLLTDLRVIYLHVKNPYMLNANAQKLFNNYEVLLCYYIYDMFANVRTLTYRIMV